MFKHDLYFVGRSACRRRHASQDRLMKTSNRQKAARPSAANCPPTQTNRTPERRKNAEHLHRFDRANVPNDPVYFALRHSLAQNHSKISNKTLSFCRERWLRQPIQSAVDHRSSPRYAIKPSRRRDIQKRTDLLQSGSLQRRRIEGNSAHD